ncbi:MAG: ABC transporter permease [Candidatus Pelagibacterales bacterium]|jgi:iron(III) transport system permease protein|nr:iron ABC transporter permease [Pelagibacteraceae bacterium]|tara:strand:- start:111 stop:1760 length:1650 start_codon:yes stop_codon:yes gene_type:complete
MSYKDFLNPWIILPTFLFALFVVPVIWIIFSLFGNYSDNWVHIYNYTLSGYIYNTVLIIIGTSIGTLIIGVGSAWLVTTYNFTGKKFLEWALLLPFAVPPYILAYTFTGLFDSYGTANNLVRDLFSLPNEFIFFPKLRNVYGASIVFSFTLYPYVYLVSRMAFINQSRSMLEVGRTLGYNKFQIFYKLSMPAIRPAIIAGLMLVLMETISDFGAVEHFAVNTFTTGIFSAWFGLYDFHTAKQLAALLLIVVISFLILEKYSRRKSRYSSGSNVFSPIAAEKLNGFQNIFASLFCFIPVFVGFVLPNIQLGYWALNYKLDFFNEKFISTAWNTFYLAITAALICAMLAVIINFSIRYKKNKVLNVMSSFLTVGYAVPGLILALGVSQLLVFMDNLIFRDYLNFILTGSIYGLILAFIIKSFALANSTIESGFLRINHKIDDVARSLNTPGWKLLFRIHLPLLTTSFLTSMILVVSEVIKELPASLILRPFNFDTLAVSTYIYAAEERMFDAAAPSIAIVAVGLLPIFVLSRLIVKSRPGYRNNDNHYQSY